LVSVPETLRSLYICYLSLDDPLVHTQVVAYLAGLAARGHTVHLLTYEPKLSRERRSALEADLRARGISWHPLRYHKRLSLAATIYDALLGAVVAARLVRRHGLDAVHARNHVPAATALIVRRLVGCKLIFDMRGLMAEEYADAGRWREGGIPYRLTKRVEAAAIRAAAGMVVLTERVRAHLFGSHQEPPTLEVIPCCADIEAIEAQRVLAGDARERLGAGARPILLYLGKFTGWYMEQEMVEFYAAARAQIPDLLLAVLTQADPAPAVAALESRGIAPDDYRIAKVAADEVGRYLAAADAGICFIRPCLSKISSSPTKIGEYLAGGLPVVSGRGIGDVDALLASDGVGLLVPEFGSAAYAEAATRLRTLLEDATVSDRCRIVARRELSLTEVGIPRYDRLYRRVALAQAVS
jgi:glycosyltransferase involved in cell wall biosynthesis